MLSNALKKAATSRKAWLAALAVVGMTAGGAAVATASAAAQPFVGAQAVLNVKDFGATGNGSSNDTPAVNNAITAANNMGGATVEFPSGTYRAGGSIHMKSNVTLQLDSGATLMGSSSGYDAPESNPNDNFQDFGHSHFHDAMIWGNNLTNIGFVGSGTIDGGGHFITGNPSSGQADKLISLTRCDGLTVSGITLRRGGHFAMLTNGCNNITSDHLNVQTADNRDGWNIINASHVTITNITIAANDDALAFKSDWALGTRFTDQGHVTVTNANLSARCCNALMFGSETCSDFTDYQFTHIHITGAGKSGLGMVSMDGAHISNVHYTDVTMSGTASPIMEKIGTRKRCGDSPGVGSISDIHYDGVTGTSAGSFSPTLWGESGTSHQVSDITFNNVNLTLPGGHAAMSDAVPSNNATDYNPKSIGTRPAYGWYIHNANGITFTNSSVRFSSSDARPAVIANTGSDILFDHFTAQSGSGSPYDFGFQTITGYCLRSVTLTGGGTPRVHTAGGSTQNCPTSDDFALSVAPPSQTVNAGDTATYTVQSSVVSGTPGPITLSASGAPSGASVSFNPNPVAAGSTSTMTVTTSSTTPNSTSTITVTGTAGGVSRSANTSLTVGTGGGGLTITGLSVADSANAADWSVQSNLRAGSVQYGDRTFTLTSVPTALQGAQWIRTANDSKGATADPLVRFTVNQQVTVAIAIDTRTGKRPWMDATWVDTGTQLVNGESTPKHFEVFQKTFPAGQVSLGPNSGTGSMYTIIVM